MTVMGIDPGLQRLGYAFLKSESNQIEVLSYGLVTTSSDLTKGERLAQIFSDIQNLIVTRKPDMVSLETLIFSRNVKTALVIGEVRGVLVLAASLMNISITEFTPLQVKSRLTGYGHASKQQVQSAIKLILGLENVPRPDDVADALAIALCGVLLSE